MFPYFTGRKGILKREEEESLVTIIKDMANSGFAPTAQQVRSFVAEYAAINEIKNPNYIPLATPSKRRSKQKIWYPSLHWMARFIKRNKLSRKRTKGMHLGRFNNIQNPFIIYSFYDLLEAELTRLNLFDRPECIWNLDESGFPLDPTMSETVSLQGQKVVKIIAGYGRDNITVLAACNAAGTGIDPLIVFESGGNLQEIPLDWIGDVGITLPDTWFGLSKRGWMTTVVFESWFKVFAKSRKERPLLLILDGHVSHLSNNTIKRAKFENLYYKVTLPYNI